MAVAVTKLLWAPQALTAKLEGAFVPAVQITAKAIAAAAPRSSNPQRGPYSKRGHMADGIKARPVSKTVGVVYIPAPGIFVIKGTRAHEIRPRRKKALAFEWGGESVVFARVSHPGTKANPFHAGPTAAFPAVYARLAAAAVLSGGGGLRL